jgi:hypothetical protein
MLSPHSMISFRYKTHRMALRVESCAIAIASALIAIAFSVNSFAKDSDDSRATRIEDLSNTISELAHSETAIDVKEVEQLIAEADHYFSEHFHNNKSLGFETSSLSAMNLVLETRLSPLERIRIFRETSPEKFSQLRKGHILPTFSIYVPGFEAFELTKDGRSIFKPTEGVIVQKISETGVRKPIGAKSWGPFEIKAWIEREGLRDDELVSRGHQPTRDPELRDSVIGFLSDCADANKNPHDFFVIVVGPVVLQNPAFYETGEWAFYSVLDPEGTVKYHSDQVIERHLLSDQKMLDRVGARYAIFVSKKVLKYFERVDMRSRISIYLANNDAD